MSTTPYVLSPDNSVQMQSSPQSRGMGQQQPMYQSFLNNLAQPQQQQQNGMQQRRKGILGGVQAVQQGVQGQQQPNMQGGGGSVSPIGTMIGLGKFLL
jgi:hypothetical protein